MSLSGEDLLFAIDGVIAQVAVAHRFYEAEGASTLPLDGVVASLSVLRGLVEAQRPGDVDESGACAHPDDQLRRQAVGGGGYYIICQACNEMIDQG